MILSFTFVCEVVFIEVEKIAGIDFSLANLANKSRLVQKQPPEAFCKKSVLKNYTNLSGKHLCQSLFFNKVSGLRSVTLLKKRLRHRRFPVNFAKILRAMFLENTSEQLLPLVILQEHNIQIPRFGSCQKQGLMIMTKSKRC